jgi:hypothetical protein
VRAASTGAVAVVVAAWFWIAVAVGAFGLVASLRPPLPQALILGLGAFTLLVGRFVPPVWAWVRTCDPRALVVPHLTRFVGIDFLVLYERGQLPYAFAVPGGWGDIVVACGAVALLALGPERRVFPRALLVWNAIGFLDILYVVATAARLAAQDPLSMRALLRLPLSLLPTFVVPLVIATHVLIFLRWRASGLRSSED